MMGKIWTDITTYNPIDDVFIDIIETRDIYESWIYSKDNSTKYFMFGCPKNQNTKADFVEMVENNLDDYLDLLEEEEE